MTLTATRRLKPIEDIAAQAQIPAQYVIPFGRHIAKIDHKALRELNGHTGRLIVVTSMSPAPAGAGKTTLTIGLTQSLRLLGATAVACIRQPSLGPFFGKKGGATGSGLCEVLPRDDIALHFTGDDHAVATAHNLIASLIDNHIYHGNRLGIDPARVLWKRVSPLNDRALRHVRINYGDIVTERAEEFRLAASSEIMAALCMSLTLPELKRRIGRMLLAYDQNGAPITADTLKATGAAAALLRNALHPNLVQSTEAAPVFVHGTPFGNISLGCSSLIATRLGLSLADYCVTETGFSTELGAEKFFNIVCRSTGLRPSAVVITASLRSLRLHGGATKLDAPNGASSLNGLVNLRKHCENISTFGLPYIIALNRFADDPSDELNAVVSSLKTDGIRAVITDVHEAGGQGGLPAASAIKELCDSGQGAFKLLYPDDAGAVEKITAIATRMYGADGAVLTDKARQDLAEIERLGFGGLPICMAKTPASLSDDASLIGRPEGFKVTIKRIYPATGAGFLIAQCGGVMLMPGLPPRPLAELIDVDEDGNMTGA